MPQVNIPQIGLVNFPDTMSPDEISATIKTKIWPSVQAAGQTMTGKIAGSPLGQPNFNAEHAAGGTAAPLTDLPAIHQVQPTMAGAEAQMPVQNQLSGQLPPERSMPGNVPLPSPTTSGMGNPMLAVLEMTQAGPIVASGMNPGVGKFLMEQATVGNVALGAILPEVWGTKVLGPAVRTALGLQGVKTAFDADVALGSQNLDPGEKRYLESQIAAGGLQSLALPKVSEGVGNIAKLTGSLIKEIGRAHV